MDQFNKETYSHTDKWKHLHKYCEEPSNNSEVKINFPSIKNKSETNSLKRLFKNHKKTREQLSKEVKYFLGALNDVKNGVNAFLKIMAKLLAVPVVLGLLITVFVNNNSSSSSAAQASTEVLKPFKNIRYNNMSLACSKSKQDCTTELYERVISIQTDKGSGTGFVIEGDEHFLTILTASHVIRTGNGHDSIINDGLYIYGKDNFGIEKPVIACAFFKNGYADVGLIKIKNTTNIIFDKMETFSSARANEKVMVIDNKYSDNKRSWIYTINSFFRNQNLLALYDSAQPGMSGSPIVKMDGSLLGILISTNSYYSQGTYKFDDILSFGIDYLNSQQNYFAPYICKQY